MADALYVVQNTVTMQRTCSKCGIEKAMDDFTKSKAYTHGRRYECKTCTSRSSTARTMRAYHAERLDLILALGGACAECGMDDLRVLDIDHVSGGGTAERKMKSGLNLLRAIAKKVAAGSSEYRLLCKNCNWIAYSERKNG